MPKRQRPAYQELEQQVRSDADTLRHHAMLGFGGKIRVPLSESAELQKIYDILNDVPDARGIRRAMALITRLQTQVSAGFHRNPSVGKFQAGTVIGKIGSDVHDVRYTHAKDGKAYEHEFNGDVEVYAVERAGKKDLLLTHIRGQPLWDEF